MKATKNAATVSIGLPVYNGEKYVREAIESVLAQTFKDLELIISDNGSTDKTGEICREYAQKDPRVCYFYNEENLGAARNFNRTFELSSGKYFKWLAADDAMEPQFLERCVKLLDNNHSLVLVCPRYFEHKEMSGLVRPIDYDHNLTFPKAHQRFRRLLSNWHRGHFYPIWGLFRSEVLRGTRLIRPFTGADECLVLELALKGKFGQVPEYLLRLRDHPDAFHIMKYRNDWREGTAEAHWYDPENTGTVFLPYWRRLYEYALLAVRSNEDLSSKLRMIIDLHLLWPRWWRRLGSELFFAVGLRPYYLSAKRKVAKYFRRQMIQKTSD